MPDFGLTSALEKAVAAGAKGARVMRPAEKALADRAAARAATAGATPLESGAADTAVGGENVAPQVTPATVPDVPVPPIVKDAAAPTLDSTVVQKPVQTHHSAAVHGVPEKVPGEAPEPGTVKSVPTPDPNAPSGGTVPPVDPQAGPAPIEPAPLSPVEEAATRISRANLGDYALDSSHMPNFDMIDTTDGIKSTIADLAEQNKVKVDEARRGTITNDQLKGLANDLDLSTDVVQKTLQRASGGTMNAETILAARQVLNSSADRISSLSDKITSGTATDIEKVQFARQLQFHSDYYSQFMGARAEAGRALNAFSIPVGANPAQAARIAELLNMNGADLMRIAKAVKLAGSVDGITKIAVPSIFRRAGSAGMGIINRIFVNGILSGPTTHLVNMTGNGVFQAMNLAETAIAARIGKFLPGADHVEVGEALASLQGMIGGTSDALRLFGKALKNGDTLDGMLKFESSGPKNTLGALPELNKPVLRQVVGGLDALLDLPTRAMGAEDEIFKTVAYRGYVQRQALLHVQDQLQAGRITMDNAAQTARDFMENAPEQTQADAEAWAREMTFQNELGPGGQAITKFLRSVPVLTLIAPFVRTPVNIFKTAAARSPMAVFSAKFWSAMQQGGAARDLALTRFALGSATSAVIAYSVMNGDVTGGGPQNPQMQQVWQANGRRPYSVRATNPVTGEVTWHSYARIEPFASVIGATADATEILSYINSDVDVPVEQEQQAYNAAGAIIAGIMNNTGNKTFMKGISDFVELTNDPTRQIKSYSNQMAASLVPYSALLRTVRNTDDPYLREAWTTLDKIRDNIPGYSKDLPLRLGLFGETRDKAGSTMLGTMSPMPESSQHYDNVTTELNNVMQATHTAPLTMPEKRIEGLHLTAGEYSQLIDISRAQPIVDGKNFHNLIEQTMNSTVYQDATPMLRADLLQHIQSQADKIGKASLEKQNPDFALRIADWRMQNNRLKFGQ